MPGRCAARSVRRHRPRFSPAAAVSNAPRRTASAIATLPNAFVYREKMVADCSCDGKSPLGLVRFDETDDPTLRAGDIVATQAGLMTYQGDGRHAGFSPVDSKIGLPAKLKEQLTQTRVAAPGPSEEAPAVVATDGRKADGRVPMSRQCRSAGASAAIVTVPVARPFRPPMAVTRSIPATRCRTV